MPCRFLRAPVGRRDGRGTQNLRLREKVDDISLGQLSSMTGIAKPHVSRAVNDLIAAGVVRRSAGTFGNSLSINKRYKQWALGGAGHVVTESVTQGLPKEQPGLPEQQPLDGVTETATSVTDSVTAAGVTDLVTGVTDSVRVTDSVTQGLPIRQPQKETIQRRKTPLFPKGRMLTPKAFPKPGRRTRSVRAGIPEQPLCGRGGHACVLASRQPRWSPAPSGTLNTAGRKARSARLSC